MIIFKMTLGYEWFINVYEPVPQLLNPIAHLSGADAFRPNAGCHESPGSQTVLYRKS